MNYESTTTTMDSSTIVVYGIVGAVLGLVAIVAMWKVFTKAGKPGWAAIIPIYNLYVLLKIAGRPGWWLILFLIPLVNIVMSFVVYVDVAKSFGKGAAFGIFMLGIFSFIGFPILGFGSAAYQGPAAARA
ncbi:MAG: DUF5684 domain-containing protein [Umezawaea sp.]